MAHSNWSRTSDLTDGVGAGPPLMNPCTMPQWRQRHDHRAAQGGKHSAGALDSTLSLLRPHRGKPYLILGELGHFRAIWFVYTFQSRVGSGFYTLILARERTPAQKPSTLRERHAVHCPRNSLSETARPAEQCPSRRHMREVA